MAELKLTLLSAVDYYELLGKGEGVVYTRANSMGLAFGCPRCGYVSTGPHKWDAATMTLTPSIKCAYPGCGYHGHLKNGIFDEV